MFQNYIRIFLTPASAGSAEIYGQCYPMRLCLASYYGKKPLLRPSLFGNEPELNFYLILMIEPKVDNLHDQ